MAQKNSVLERSAESLVQQVKDAIDDKSVLHIQGGGSKAFYGNPAHENSTVLNMLHHEGVIDYAPEELMIHVKAGTRLADVVRLLKENDQILAFEPPDFNNESTIGGVVAAGISGPRRPYAGSVRDFVLGVTLITGSGDVLSFGGQVMKNVAGYDVSRLVTGALGTLGVILDVSLKVLPAPEIEKTVLRKMSVEKFLPSLQSLPKNLPLSAVAYEDGSMRIRISGSRVAVDAALEVVAADEIDSAYWQKANTLAGLTEADTNKLWRVSVAPNSGLFLEQAARIDWAGGLRWLKDPEFDPREQLSGNAGHATFLTGQGMKQRMRQSDSELNEYIDVFQPLAEPLLGIHKRLKKQFDPLGIFNPGRMYKDI
jgi:glycolate oxidase FAD binding subunit